MKKIQKQEKRYRLAKDNLPVTKPFDKAKYRKAKNDLKPECFFYQCDVPKRTEEIGPCKFHFVLYALLNQLFYFLVAKIMQNKVIERAFNKEMSVFAKWKADTPASLSTAFNEDIKQWKGYRFIKSEEDRADTEEVLKKYFLPLKETFLHVASTSSWPNIGQLDFCDLSVKAKFLD